MVGCGRNVLPWDKSVNGEHPFGVRRREAGEPRGRATQPFVLVKDHRLICLDGFGGGTHRAAYRCACIADHESQLARSGRCPEVEGLVGDLPIVEPHSDERPALG